MTITTRYNHSAPTHGCIGDAFFMERQNCKSRVDTFITLHSTLHAVLYDKVTVTLTSDVMGRAITTSQTQAPDH